MNMQHRVAHGGLACTLLLSAVGARAEGTAEMGANGRVQKSTQLRIDIVDAAVERIAWRGESTLEVRSPVGAAVAVLASGTPTGSLAGVGNGTYQLVLGDDQDIADFDIAVVDAGGAVLDTGRLFAVTWNLRLATATKTTPSTAASSRWSMAAHPAPTP